MFIHVPMKNSFHAELFDKWKYLKSCGTPNQLLPKQNKMILFSKKTQMEWWWNRSPHTAPHHTKKYKNRGTFAIFLLFYFLVWCGAVWGAYYHHSIWDFFHRKGDTFGNIYIHKKYFNIKNNYLASNLFFYHQINCLTSNLFFYHPIYYLASNSWICQNFHN